jgi:hypothetical protein
VGCEVACVAESKKCLFVWQRATKVNDCSENDYAEVVCVMAESKTKE